MAPEMENCDKEELERMLYGKNNGEFEKEIERRLRRSRLDFMSSINPGQRIMEAGGSWRLVAPDAAVQNTLHIKNVYDFDLHEEYPNGQNILHFATYTQDSCNIQQLLSHGLDVNKGDKFGRTPLYYALASKNKFKKRPTIRSLLIDGATLGPLPETDTGPLRPTLASFLDVFDCFKSAPISCNSSDMKKIIKFLVIAVLKQNMEDRQKWRIFQTVLDDIWLPVHGGIEDPVILFKCFFLVVEEVCSEMGIENKVLHPSTWALKVACAEVVKHFHLLKFLFVRRTSLTEDCLPNVNFLDLAIKAGNMRSVEFLVSIGARPKETLGALGGQDGPIDPAVKAFVNKSRLSPLSLQNLCRLNINKSLNVENIVKICHSHVGRFIKYEWL